VLEASDNDVRWMGRVRLGGEISSSDASCTDEETVEIARRLHGTDTFTEFGTAVTDEDGVFTAIFRAPASADYRAVAPAHDNCADASSSPVTIEVRAAVRISTSDRRPARGTDVRIVVRVSPAHRGTEVLLERKKGNRFVRVAAADLSRRGRATFTVTAGWRGDRTFRGKWVAQDDDHESSTSRGLEIHTER
jgi:hypothetical protein